MDHFDEEQKKNELLQKKLKSEKRKTNEAVESKLQLQQ